MDGFDKWVDENYPNVDNHHAWNFQQKKIDDAKKLADELWEESSEGRKAELIIQIQEVLK